MNLRIVRSPRLSWVHTGCQHEIINYPSTSEAVRAGGWGAGAASVWRFGLESPCYPAAGPPLIRRYIKTSFLFLLAGLLVGSYIAVAQFILDAYPPRLLITAHAHLLLVGFMLMIVVATWMFPRPARDDTRYRPELAGAVYWMMTIATAVRAVAEISVGLAGTPGLRWVIAIGGLGQLVGTALFVLNMWWRVRMPPAAAPSTR